MVCTNSEDAAPVDHDTRDASPDFVTIKERLSEQQSEYETNNIDFDPSVRLLLMPCEDISAIEVSPHVCLKIVELYGEKTLACMQLLNEVTYRLCFKSLICDLYYVPSSDLVALVNNSSSRISLVGLSSKPEIIELSGTAILHPDYWNISTGHDYIDLKLLHARYRMKVVQGNKFETTDIATGHVEYSLETINQLHYAETIRGVWTEVTMALLKDGRSEPKAIELIVYGDKTTHAPVAIQNSDLWNERLSLYRSLRYISRPRLVVIYLH